MHAGGERKRKRMRKARNLLIFRDLVKLVKPLDQTLFTKKIIIKRIFRYIRKLHIPLTILNSVTFLRLFAAKSWYYKSGSSIRQLGKYYKPKIMIYQSRRIHKTRKKSSLKTKYNKISHPFHKHTMSSRHRVDSKKANIGFSFSTKKPVFRK